MALSRRQFFTQFWNSEDKSRPRRIARYKVMETFVWSYIVPYDFSLNPEQEAELFAEVRKDLEEATDDELFSNAIRLRLEKLSKTKIEPWREENRLKELADRVKEIREAAVNYVGTFISAQATPAAVALLKQRFAAWDTSVLETELSKRVQDWIASVSDEELLQYDVVTVKDLVFEQLRSWC